MSARFRFGMLALGCVMLAGCRHKVTAVVPVASTAPVPLDKTPEPKTPPTIPPVPLTPAPLPAVTVKVKKPRPPKKKVAPPEPAPVQVASAGPAPDPGAVIGALTVGGDDAPEKRRQANELIGDLDKRLAGLSAAVLEGQKDGIARVRYFEKEARAALDSGDVQGAVTLVTKGKVLLDDLLK